MYCSSIEPTISVMDCFYHKLICHLVSLTAMEGISYTFQVFFSTTFNQVQHLFINLHYCMGRPRFFRAATYRMSQSIQVLNSNKPYVHLHRINILDMHGILSYLFWKTMAQISFFWWAIFACPNPSLYFHIIVVFINKYISKILEEIHFLTNFKTTYQYAKFPA